MAFASGNAADEYQGSPAEKVAAILADIDAASGNAQLYAGQAFDTANTFMAALSSGLDDFVPPVITPVFPATPDAPPIATTAIPTLEGVDVNFPSQPSEFTGELSLEDFLPEPFDGTPPSLVLGAVPTFVGDVPDAPPVDFTLTIPELADIVLPAAPELMTVNIAPFEGISIPAFTEEVTELTVPVPTIVQYEPGDLYVSGLLSSIQTTLQDRIDNGGTGLSADVEGAIWDREREREAIATRDALAELDQFESRGFALPPGAYVDQHLKITTEMHARTVSLGRDIAIKQAELELENIVQALNTATTLEGQLISYANATEQRVFEAVKYATEAGVGIYNARVQAYAAFLSAYAAKVEIYKAQISGELAQVDAYRAEVDAEGAKAEANTAKVQAYTALIQGALANVDVFTAEVQAVVAKSEIEKAKVQIFGEQVRAFAATVSAYTAETEGFKATVQGEIAKQDAYRSQVQSYTAETQAQAAAVGAKVSAYTAEISAKNLEWEGYKSVSASAAEHAKVISSQNSTVIDAYRGEVIATASYNDTLTKQWQATIDNAYQVANVGVAAAKANAEFYVTSRTLALESAKVGAQVTAQLAAAAMNAVNYSVSGSGSATVSGSDVTQTNYNL